MLSPPCPPPPELPLLKQKDRIKGNQEDEDKRNLDEVRVLKR
ncbi:hypothetical protein COLO4_26596 [Corchorus olitorius]|uniref:Uncharacterized protein n=1 Tax=Corchorus olitorius TaxID=93759 RepID=A0A1R3HW08_9ROSI|nr:hypothetical protein COLO4_26596 [Corchorus olitorius]